MIFFHNKKNTISEDTITAFGHNVRSFSKHINDIASDGSLINYDIIVFKET